MKRLPWIAPLVAALGFVLAVGVTPGCDCASSGANGNGDGGNGDGGNGNHDSGLNACGDNDPACMAPCIGPTCNPPSQFPLPDDQPPPTNVTADGVNRDPNGYIILDQSKANFDFLWIADDQNYNVGLVSKISTKARATPYPNGQYYGEVARYVTFTCQSAVRDQTGTVQTNPNATKEGIVLGQDKTGLCANGMNGCCAWDYRPAGAGGAAPGVNPYQNRPSRTAVDFNGDVWVANRGFGRQGSVTKIANTKSDCIERNGIAGIQTSDDVNQDGIITTDCDGNNLPDDASTVCTGGRAHEFYGLDDECILFTVNIGQNDALARPLALGPGTTGPDPMSAAADAWAGTWSTAAQSGPGAFYRVNGATGKVMTVVPMLQQAGVDPHPYGAAIDSFGILWAPNEGSGNLFYIDTNAANPAAASAQGMVSEPLGGGGFYGLSLDGYKDAGGNLIQQIWLGDVGTSGAYRYRPVRSGGFAGLGTGTWARASFTGGPTRGRGIGVDNRSPTSYAWVALDGCCGGTNAAIGRIPYDIPDNTTTSLTTYFNTLIAATPAGQADTLGAGVAIDGDIWGINSYTSTATHFKVDAMGNVLNSGTPDIIPLNDNPGNAAITPPYPYTYSDFTGFGLRNFTNPHGTYEWIQTGCGPAKTRWIKIIWDAETLPPTTTLTVKARSADDVANLSSALFTGEYDTSPADLTMPPGPVLPNPSGFLDVQFILRTQDKSLTPKLKSFIVVYECLNGIG
jgi:hypothetical protein